LYYSILNEIVSRFTCVITTYSTLDNPSLSFSERLRYPHESPQMLITNGFLAHGVCYRLSIFELVAVQLGRHKK
jgi:hypothetical protein